MLKASALRQSCAVIGQQGPGEVVPEAEEDEAEEDEDAEVDDGAGAGLSTSSHP